MAKSKYAGRIDENQPEIVKALRGAGATVSSLANVGNDVPDLIVGYRGVNYLIEVIGDAKFKRFKKNGGLSEGQLEWHTLWGGRVAGVRTSEQALAYIGAIDPDIASIPVTGTIS